MKKIAGLIGGISLLLLASGSVFAGGPWNANSAQFGSLQVACLMDAAASSQTIDDVNSNSQSAMTFLHDMVMSELEASKPLVVDPVLMMRVKYLQLISGKMNTSIETVLNAPVQQKLYRAKMAAIYAHILNGELSKLVPNPNTGCG